MYGDENLIWVSKSKMRSCTGNGVKRHCKLSIICCQRIMRLDEIVLALKVVRSFVPINFSSALSPSHLQLVSVIFIYFIVYI